jgi:4-alpha-glucanotransferase
MTTKRASGILLHITSLPSAYGIGDLGPWAYRFVDMLAATGQKYWQILPLNPTGSYMGNSPYNSYSAFAANPLLISPELLAAEGLLSQSELEVSTRFPENKVDYQAVIQHKGKLLRLAFDRFKSKIELQEPFQKFCNENSTWLEDYSLFGALKEKFNEVAWFDWPEEVRSRKPETIQKLKKELSNRIQMSKFFQYVTYRQWFSIRDYCNSKKIEVIGDLPIYTSIDSSDVWSEPQFFKLDKAGQPLFVAGAPPDYFSATGQRWGNPVYQWDVMKANDYSWWIRRIEQNQKLFHMIRFDHFRGFVAYWEIPANEQTAVKGKWVEAPAVDFFSTILRRFPDLPIIVEDLGLITPDVKEVITRFRFPGMKVLLFAFGGDLPTHPYAPHNYNINCVVYTGTHDNNTILGWFRNEASVDDKRRLFQYIGREVSEDQVPWEMIRLAMSSVAKIAIIPLQDILGLGEEARMNLPSLSRGNWGWRFSPHSWSSAIPDKLLSMTRLYGRATIE